MRDDKGSKDRITMLPGTLVAPLQRHLERVRQLHQDDVEAGLGQVYLPDAFARKYPHAKLPVVWIPAIHAGTTPFVPARGG